jgi:hypothetical protein
MVINLKKTTKKDIASIKGIRLGVTSAGIKDDATDLLVIVLPDNSSVAGVFTQNQFCAAPVILSKITWHKKIILGRLSLIVVVRMREWANKVWMMQKQFVSLWQSILILMKDKFYHFQLDSLCQNYQLKKLLKQYQML